MLSLNQIAGFSNQLFLQNIFMKQPHFFHVDTNSQELKGAWSFVNVGIVENGFSQTGDGAVGITKWTDIWKYGINR